MTTEEEKVATHYDAVADNYHLQYDRSLLRSAAVYPANYARLQMLCNRLAQTGARRLYEIGVGEGTPLVSFARLGIEVAGCDLAEAMVVRAQENLERNGFDPSTVQWADIEDSLTMLDQLKDGPYDAVIASGVLPHVGSDTTMLENVKMLLRPGGTAFIEFRNKLFSLFTFNRNTKEFILDDLLSVVSPEVRDAVAAQLDAVIAIDQPPRRDRLETGEVGYDALRARFHNPFELLETFEELGFVDCRTHWYHYHPAPPMFEAAIGKEAFREEGLRLEHETSGWRGMFLCSAGVIEARLEG